jgi:hypothetical protein
MSAGSLVGAVAVWLLPRTPAAVRSVQGEPVTVL